MPATRRPCFPEELTPINKRLGVICEDNQVSYLELSDGQKIGGHAADSYKEFRFVTAQFCDVGATKATEIARVFGVSVYSVRRDTRLRREQKYEELLRES